MCAILYLQVRETHMTDKQLRAMEIEQDQRDARIMQQARKSPVQIARLMGITVGRALTLLGL